MKDIDRIRKRINKTNNKSHKFNRLYGCMIFIMFALTLSFFAVLSGFNIGLRLFEPICKLGGDPVRLPRRSTNQSYVLFLLY